MNIHAVFHYMCLHKSEYYLRNNDKIHLPNSDRYEKRLVRLPFYFELSLDDQIYITNAVKSFLKTKLNVSLVEHFFYFNSCSFCI